MTTSRSEAGRRGAKVTNRRRRAQGVASQQEDKMSFLKTTHPVAKLRSGPGDWYRFENSSGDTTDIYIYDEIGYWGITAQDFVQSLAQVTTPNINLYISSPGGSVFDGLAMYNSLVRHQSRVNVTIDGLAASAAAFIAMAGDQVEIARNAIMMIHDAWGLAIGGPADMAEMAELLDMHSDNIADIFSQHGNGTAAEFRDLMRAETWMTAQEAVDLGLADRVVNSRDSDEDDEQDPENLFDLSIFTYAGRSKAPAPKIPSDTTDEPGSKTPENKDSAGTEPADEYEGIDWAALSGTLVKSVSP